MYLSQALTKVRNLKSKLSRVNKIIDKIAIQYEDATPDYVFTEELKERLKLIEELRVLKTQIALTNARTEVVFNKEQMTLAELILINADTRSELAFVTSLLDLTTEEQNSWKGSRSKDDVRKVFAEGYSKTDLRKTLEELELKKERIESLIQEVNAGTKL